MRKREARELSDAFRERLPHLFDRPCRVCVAPWGDHTIWYLVPRGPRGGLRPKERLTWATDGFVYLRLRTGDIVLEETSCNRWMTYNSFVALPQMEDLSDLALSMKPEFTLEEKLASTEFLYDFLVERHARPEELRDIAAHIIWLREYLRLEMQALERFSPEERANG